jgi:hypothetical protein
MPLYTFVRWEDGNGVVLGTTPTLTYPVTADMTFRAVYAIVMRNVTYESTPISVEAVIDSTPIPPGTIIPVEDGQTITITVPAQVEA